MQAQDLQNLISHADCKGNTRGSRTAGQADNVSVSRKQAHNPAQTEKGCEKKSHPDCDNRPATQDRCGGTTHDRKSPIISPDCENGKGVLDFTRNVRERANKTPLLAIRPQPRSRPDQPVYPSINAGQEIVSTKEGGYVSSVSRRERGWSGKEVALCYF